MTPEERRAILSAAVHCEPIVLWYIDKKPPCVTGLESLNLYVERAPIPEWVPSTYRDQIFDILAYDIMYEHGGLILQLDTISIRPAWDLLTTQEIVVATDWVDGNPEVLTNPAKLAYPYNCNFLARKGSDIALAMLEEAKRRIISDEPEFWGQTGPYMLSQFVRDYPGRMEGAPFPALCGWAPGYLWRFYLGLETPGPNVRVIHLCRQAFRSLYDRRYHDWAGENPYYAGEVARRTDANDLLLRCP